MTADEISRRTRLLENEIRVLKDESTRLSLDLSSTKEKVKDNKDDSNARESAETLFQTAMIESGYEISDPSDLAARVYRLMSKQLGVDPDEAVKDIELPEEEEEELESLDLLDSTGLLSFELDSVLLSLFLDSVPLSVFFVSSPLSLFLDSVPLSLFLESLLPSSELSGLEFP